MIPAVPVNPADPGGFQIRALPERLSLVATVVVQMTEQIRSGAVAPGARLPAEAELSRMFGVSRTVVREAVARLKADELVRTLPGQGLFVTDRGPGAGVLRLKAPAGDPMQAVSSLLEFRAGLETESARFAALRRTAADVVALTRAFKRLADVQGEGGRGSDEDLTFHLEIARASRNSYIIQVLEFLATPIHAAISRSRALDATRSDLLAQAHAEHAAIFDAIVAGDPPRAVQAMRAHLEAGQVRLLMSAKPADPIDRTPSPEYQGSTRNR